MLERNELTLSQHQVHTSCRGLTGMGLLGSGREELIACT